MNTELADFQGSPGMPLDRPLRVLSLDDSLPDAELILNELQIAGIDSIARNVENERDFRKLLVELDPDVVLLDYMVPGFEGPRAMRICKELKPGLPVIFVSGAIGEEKAVDLLKDGATDYVLKDRLTRLPFAVRRALSEAAEHRARRAAEEALRELNQELETRVTERTLELSEKNRLLEEELRMAREFQIALLPQHPKILPETTAPGESALRFLRYFRPSGMVSGDFYDIVRLSEKTIGVLICDVMGHDVRAALVAGMLRAVIHERGSLAAEPGAFLAHVNRSLAAMFREAGTTMFATAFYIVVDLDRRELHFANAGHPSPLQVHRRRHKVDPLSTNGHTGPALGLMPDAVYGTSSCPIEPGDSVMLFTDGLFEVEDPQSHQAFTRQRLLDAARRYAAEPASALFDGLLQEVREFAHGANFSDDVCLLGLEFCRTS